MADFSSLKTSIQNYIKQNGNEEITGNLLQQILLSMVTTLGDSAINDLVTALNTEIANRGNADTELGGRITTLQGIVNGIKADVENGYVYAGIATPSTTPASGKVFYLALTAGTYTNFGTIVVPQGINILKYNGSAWSLDSFLGLDDAPTQGSNNLVKSGGVADKIGIPIQLHGYIADGTGIFHPQPSAWSFLTTEYIPVTLGNTIIFYGKQETGDFITCYAEDKSTVISVIDSSDKDNYVLNTITLNDERIKYVRCCSYDDKSNVPYVQFSSNYDTCLNIEALRNEIKETFNSDLIDNAFSQDGYIDENGVFHATSVFKSTDFIPVIQGIKYSIKAYGENGSTSLVAFYDINKNLISNIVTSQNTYQYAEGYAPQDAAYLRTTCWPQYVSNCYCKVGSLGNIANSIFKELDIVSLPININGYIDENGVFHSTPAFKATDYIPVFEGLKYIIKAFGESGSTSVVAFYDSEKNVVSNFVTTQNDYQYAEGYVPSGVSYLRMCCWPQYVGNCYCRVGSIHNLENIIIERLSSIPYKYGNNIRKPYDFSNKHFVAFGDSITAGTYSYDGGMDDTIIDAYITILANKLGVNFTFATDNKAQGGTGFCYYPSQYPGKQKITDVILNFTGDADVIYIAGGTNDYQMNMPVGNLGDTTIDTVYGALYLICEYLKTNYPNAIVFFATPINWSYNRSGLTSNINSYRNAIFEVATMYGYNVVDCSKMAFPDIQEGISNPTFKNALIYDGIHPTLLGHKYMGENIASLLI